MRTLMLIVGGFVLWAVCLGIAKLAGKASASSLTLATLVFAAIWFVLAAANMWVGMTHGYSFKEELPIFLLIFLLPVVVAAFVRWRFL